MENPLYGIGDLVIFNETGEFGNENDHLFHIHSMRYDTCTGSSEKQYWYAGYLLEIGDYESKGLPQIPIFWTTIANASEDKLQALEDLKICFNPYK